MSFRRENQQYRNATMPTRKAVRRDTNIITIPNELDETEKNGQVFHKTSLNAT